MAYNTTTIVAVSTPPGTGGIAVLRLSGPEAFTIADRVWRGASLSRAASHTAHLGKVLYPDGETLDEVVATVYRAPNSFTGEDTVEFSCHGSQFIQKELLNRLVEAGAQPAGPGEFTSRAFLNGKIDLSQAEAIADLISSSSKATLRLANSQMRGRYAHKLRELRDHMLKLSSLLELELDFSEEDVEFASRAQLLELSRAVRNETSRMQQSFARGNAIKNGIPVVIAGETNVGKSSLLNVLVGEDRAIVSNIHGTTRDLIEDTVTIGDYLFRITDTAGLRTTADEIESVGIDRAHAAMQRASLLIYLLDASRPHEVDWDKLHSTLASLPEDTQVLIAINKTDLEAAEPLRHLVSQRLASVETLPISTKNQEGIEDLKGWLVSKAGAGNGDSDDVIITNARHAQALRLTTEALERVEQGIVDEMPGDLIAQDLREALTHLGEITATITTPEILHRVFSTFCIGK